MVSKCSCRQSSVRYNLTTEERAKVGICCHSDDLVIIVCVVQSVVNMLTHMYVGLHDKQWVFEPS